MHILAHRGFWNEDILCNSPPALKSALERGFGFESDIRDYMGKVVISHDIADKSSQDVQEVFQMLSAYGDKYCFAINVKADGLKGQLKHYVEKYHIHNYFLFDMSVPQMVEFEKAGLRFFTRQSEYEATPVMYEQSAGVWIDGFESTDWITEELLKKHISYGKEVCLVSPELHGNKDYELFWHNLRNWDIDLFKVFLCTDYPEKAREYFSDLGGNGNYD